jgi:hypothetical protein
VMAGKKVVIHLKQGRNNTGSTMKGGIILLLLS